MSVDIQHILSNMQAGLQDQAEKVREATKHRDNFAQNIAKLEAQLNETKVVMDELGKSKILFLDFSPRENRTALESILASRKRRRKKKLRSKISFDFLFDDLVHDCRAREQLIKEQRISRSCR